MFTERTKNPRNRFLKKVVSAEDSVMRVIWRNMVLMFFKNRWGRGQPDIGAINLGDEKFDPDSDKKRTGQILWIRGLTRLQTQVTIHLTHSLFLYHYLIYNKLSIFSQIFCYYILSHFIYWKKLKVQYSTFEGS